MPSEDVIAVRGNWYHKRTRRFLGRVVEGEPAPDGGLKPQTDLTKGSIADVLDRVGDDADKAEKALAQEKAKDDPRKTLIDDLESIVEDSADE